MSKRVKYCYPQCTFFRCGQRALDVKGQRTFCRWVGDKCTGGTCNYVSCIKSRLLPNGVCGLSVKRLTYEETAPELIDEPEIRLKGKLLKRFKGDEFF